MPRNKLQIDQVIEILTTQAHIPSRQVAQKYGVCRTTITHLRRGWSWKTQLSMLQTVGILPKSAWGINKEPMKRTPRKLKVNPKSGQSAPTEADPETYPLHTHK